jgi:hypothetical protein
MLTAFSPASWPAGAPGSANGDGNFLYPCEDGPCATIRLKNLRDGIEDSSIPRFLDSSIALVYPGEDGPLSSIRLENLADGIDD